MRLWIEYLGNQTTFHTETMLKEALELTNDDTLQLEMARKYCTQHPSLYEQYLLNNVHKKEDTELLAIGKVALGAIDDKYIVRSRIALLMSTMALNQGIQAEAESYWLEAFRSDTTVVNYIRLFMECTDFS